MIDMPAANYFTYTSNPSLYSTVSGALAASGVAGATLASLTVPAGKSVLGLVLTAASPLTGPVLVTATSGGVTTSAVAIPKGATIVDMLFSVPLVSDGTLVIKALVDYSAGYALTCLAFWAGSSIVAGGYSFPFTLRASSTDAWSAMPAAVTFYLGKSFNTVKKDLTKFSQVRFISVQSGAAAASGAKLILKYFTSFSTLASDYLNIGTSEVSTPLNTGAATYMVDSGWVDLAPGAKGDVFLTVVGSGGDGVASPAFGDLTIEFR